MKYVSEDANLLKKNEILINGKARNFDEGDLESYLRQKTNKKLLGFRVYLWLYNRIDPAKEAEREIVREERLDKINERRFNRQQKLIKKIDAKRLEDKRKGITKERKIRSAFYDWLQNKEEKEEVISFYRWIRNLGEPPVELDNSAITRTCEQMELFIKNKGYYDVKVSDTVVINEKKRTATVTYIVQPNVPFVIDRVNYSLVKDSVLSQIFDTTASLIKPSMLFDTDILQAERLRIADSLKNNGYYFFGEQYIYFRADTALGNKRVALEIGIKPQRVRLNDSVTVEQNHNPYLINDIFIYPDYDIKQALLHKDAYYDSLIVEPFSELNRKANYFFLYNHYPLVKHSVLARSVQITDKMFYNEDVVNETYKYLGALGVFKMTNIQFAEVENSTENLLDCHIQLTPTDLQSYSLELEGTNSSGNLGAAANLLYRHGNLFHGAEVFNFKFSYGREYQQSIVSSEKRFKTNEVMVESTVDIPKLVIAFFKLEQLKKNAPKTSVNVSFNYQDRPDYTRTIFNASFGYYWKSSEYITHRINPFEFYSTKIAKIDSAFVQYLERANLAESYRDHMISAINYQIIFNNQNINKRTDFTFFSGKIETAGNIVSLIHNWSNTTIDPDYGVHTVFQTPYNQYVSVDLDYRYNNVINQRNTMVYRVFTGAVIPYGNTTYTPFEKQYFSGGANSLRGWRTRSIGPGTYDLYSETSEITSYANQRADVKIELNAEYRFKITPMFEGALFADAGNIWSLNQEDDREGAIFDFSTFYKQLAINTGIGFRIDVTYLIVRFDLGIQLREPRYMGSPWRSDNLQPKTRLNFGIGYPF